MTSIKTQTDSWGSNPGGGEIFCIHPDRRWGQPSLRVSFPEVKRPRRGVNHPPPTTAEVKERVELHIYSPLYLRGLLQSYFHCNNHGAFAISFVLTAIYNSRL